LDAPKGRRDEFVEPYFKGSEPDAVAVVRIPRQSGRGFRFDVGHHSDLIPATIPK
jgi:hypothetical protein